MRNATSLLLILALVTICSAAGLTYQGSRTKGRTIRGFKNVALSTARGFGKRDAMSECCDQVPDSTIEQGKRKGFKNEVFSGSRGFGKRAMDYLAAPASYSEQLPDGIPDSFPVDWFVEELQNNPDLARIIVHKFLDANEDGELSAEELLRPMY